MNFRIWKFGKGLYRPFPKKEPKKLTLTLRDQGGLPLPGGEVQLTLPANGHLAKFIHELFPESDTREFTGSLGVTSANGPIAGLAIQLGGRQGEFTTLPVVPLR